MKAAKDKAVLLKENKGKTGVYCLINLINGKSYRGSTINLKKKDLLNIII